MSNPILFWALVSVGGFAIVALVIVPEILKSRRRSLHRSTQLGPHHRAYSMKRKAKS